MDGEMKSQIAYKVEDMRCKNCKKVILANLLPIEGILKLSVDLKSKTVTVVYDKTLIVDELIQAKLQELDFPVTAKTTAQIFAP